MPHLPPLANDEATAEARRTLEVLQTKLGQVPNMYRTFAHASRILDATVAMAQAIRRDFNGKLRELAYLKVSQLTDCHVCVHYHEAQGRAVGMSDEQILDLDCFEQSGAYSDDEKDVLRFAEQWTTNGRVSADVIDRLKHVLGSSGLVILAATVSQANFTSRFNNVFEVELP